MGPFLLNVGMEGKVVVGGSIGVVSLGPGKRCRVQSSLAAVVSAATVACVAVKSR